MAIVLSPDGVSGTLGLPGKVEQVANVCCDRVDLVVGVKVGCAFGQRKTSETLGVGGKKVEAQD